MIAAFQFIFLVKIINKQILTTFCAMNFQNLKFQKFTKQHISEYLAFCYDAYLAGTDNYFADTPQAREQFNLFTTKGLTQMIEAAQTVNSRRGTNTLFNFFVSKDGQMIAAYFHCELHYLFKELIQKQNFQNNVYRAIPLEIVLNVKEHSAVLGYRSATKASYHKSGLFQYIESYRKKLFLNEGYDYVYAITTNPKILGFYKKNNGQILHTFNAQFLSVPHQIQLLRLKFANVPEYQNKEKL